MTKTTQPTHKQSTAQPAQAMLAADDPTFEKVASIAFPTLHPSGIAWDAALRAQVTLIAAHADLPFRDAALLCHVAVDGENLYLTPRIAFETPDGLRLSEADVTGDLFGVGMDALYEVAIQMVEAFEAPQPGEVLSYALTVLNRTPDGLPYQPGTPFPDFNSRIMFEKAIPTLNPWSMVEDDVEAVSLFTRAQSLFDSGTDTFTAA